MGARRRAQLFCARYGLQMPILQAPMSGACPPELAVAVASAGGMGGSGVLLDPPERIAGWVERFRAGSSSGSLQLNIWIPDPPSWSPQQDDHVRAFLSRFGPPGEPPGPAPDFDEQCEAMLVAGPTVISSIMGVFRPEYVQAMHERGIAWFACATTLEEALAAQEAGADAVVGQGMEAGGHRGTFDPDDAESTQVGLFALIPRLVDGLRVPVIAAGGIADGRGVAAALTLGASAVQVGTALLRSPETAISTRWAASLDGLAPEDTITTRAYSGRLGRAAPTPYVSSWTRPDAPRPVPYPEQRRLLTQWRQGISADEPATDRPALDRANHWAGQNAALATDQPAARTVTRMWQEAYELLPVADTR